MPSPALPFLLACPPAEEPPERPAAQAAEADLLEPGPADAGELALGCDSDWRWLLCGGPLFICCRLLPIAAPLSLPPPACLANIAFICIAYLQVRRDIQPIVSRNRYRRDGTSAYQLLAEQQRPAAAKAGKERLQVIGDWKALQGGGQGLSFRCKGSGRRQQQLGMPTREAAVAAELLTTRECCAIPHTLPTGRARVDCGDAGARRALPRAL